MRSLVPLRLRYGAFNVESVNAWKPFTDPAFLTNFLGMAFLSQSSC